MNSNDLINERRACGLDPVTGYIALMTLNRAPGGIAESLDAVLVAKEAEELFDTLCAALPKADLRLGIEGEEEDAALTIALSPDDLPHFWDAMKFLDDQCAERDLESLLEFTFPFMWANYEPDEDGCPVMKPGRLERLQELFSS